LRWGRFAAVGITLLLCGLALLWYGRVWIHGGEFRKYLILNGVVVCSLSFILFALSLLNLKAAQWLAVKMNRWLVLWAGLGLLLPVPLFVVDRFAPFYLGEKVWFTLWPSNVILMAADDSWGLFLIVMPISMAFNATIYAGWSVIIWVVCRAVSRHSA